MSKPPAFQFYPENFLAGTAEMTAEEVGAYIRLLCHQWHKGAVPDNDKRLMQLTGARKNAISEIRKKFSISENGLLNIRLERSRQEQEDYRNKQKENALKRWSKPMPPHIPPDIPPHENGICQTDALQSSSSSSINKEREYNTLTREEIDKTSEYIDRTLQVKLLHDDVVNFWEAFKINQAEPAYISRDKKVQHFRDWLKGDRLKNKNNGKKTEPENTPKRYTFSDKDIRQ